MLFVETVDWGADMLTQETAAQVVEEVRVIQSSPGHKRTVALAAGEFDSWRRKWLTPPEPEPEPEPAPEAVSEDLDWV